MRSALSAGAGKRPRPIVSRLTTPSGVRLVASAAGGLQTLNAARPLLGGQLSYASFAAQVLTTELPRPTMGLQAAVAAALAVRRGWTRTDLLSAALIAASWTGLARLSRQANKSSAVLEQALVEALGADYRDRALPVLPPAPGAAEPKDPTLLRVLRIRQRYAYESDLSYGAADRNLLDIWCRPDLNPKTLAPVLLQVPGGAWVIGGRRGQAYPLMAHLAERGWICVSIGYRLAPKQKWPAMIVDVKRALAWVKRNIANYGGDPDFIAITGGSAGGHLCALAALTANDPDFQPGFEDADTTVQAAVPLYGVYDWTAGVGTEPLLQPFLERWVVSNCFADDPGVYRQASPVHRASPSAPPFFVLHGTQDNLVPVAQTRRFVERLRNSSKSPVVYGELPGAPHAFEMLGSGRSFATADAVGRFLATVYGDHVRTSVPRSDSVSDLV
jgi:acetyl esterase/lipase